MEHNIECEYITSAYTYLKEICFTVCSGESMRDTSQYQLQ